MAGGRGGGNRITLATRSQNAVASGRPPPLPRAHWLLEAVFWGKQKALHFPLRKS